MPHAGGLRLPYVYIPYSVFRIPQNVEYLWGNSTVALPTSTFTMSDEVHLRSKGDTYLLKKIKFWSDSASDRLVLILLLPDLVVLLLFV